MPCRERLRSSLLQPLGEVSEATGPLNVPAQSQACRAWSPVRLVGGCFYLPPESPQQNETSAPQTWLTVGGRTFRQRDRAAIGGWPG